MIILKIRKQNKNDELIKKMEKLKNKKGGEGFQPRTSAI